MLEYDSRIAVGVSGGKDSLGLLYILDKLGKKFPNSELVAISIDEGVRGYRDEALDIASEACKSLDIEHIVYSFRKLFGVTMDEIASNERDLVPCSYCGVLRRRALNKAALDVMADRLATGHNLDDMAQTAILNIIRGDINRLYTMYPGGRSIAGFIKRIKPLCEIPERETTFYAYLEGFRFQEFPCPYSKEAMRNDARDFLNRMEFKRPGTKFTVYKTAIKLIPINQSSSNVKNICKICGEPTSQEVCRVCHMIKSL